MQSVPAQKCRPHVPAQANPKPQPNTTSHPRASPPPLRPNPPRAARPSASESDGPVSMELKNSPRARCAQKLMTAPSHPPAGAPSTETPRAQTPNPHGARSKASTTPRDVATGHRPRARVPRAEAPHGSRRLPTATGHGTAEAEHRASSRAGCTGFVTVLQSVFLVP